MLPDVALVVVFDDYVNKGFLFEWHILVKVCRTWRNVIFGSPRRLHLQLLLQGLDAGPGDAECLASVADCRSRLWPRKVGGG
jgi:hypothetical protein